MDGDLIAALSLGGLMLITPIVFILTKHQQKMATILRENQTSAPQPQMDAVLRELAGMREVMNQQAIAIDDLRQNSSQNVTRRMSEINQ